MEYLLRDEAYQRKADVVAARALHFAFCANDEWNHAVGQAAAQNWDQATGEAMDEYLRLVYWAGKAIGKGGCAEFSPVITDPINVPQRVLPLHMARRRSKVSSLGA